MTHPASSLPSSPSSRKGRLFLFPLFFFLPSIAIGVWNYCATRQCIQRDVDEALLRTMKVMPVDRIDADTIRCYRHFIAMAEVRDTAYLALVAPLEDDCARSARIVAVSGCSWRTVWHLSDQRASSALLLLSLASFAGSLWRGRRRLAISLSAVPEAADTFGGLRYEPSSDRFVTVDGRAVRFTPMQQALMVMFFKADGHTLTKQQITDSLWPGKPDASDTLYTLIRRLKPVLSSCSRLQIECERGRAYRLTDRRVG